MSVDEELAEMKKLCSIHEDTIDRLRGERDNNYQSGKEWKARAEVLEKEIGFYKEELHALTVEKARLEGYLDRAREFDPNPEPVMVPLERQSQGRFDMSDMYGTSRDKPLPWYRRNVG